MAPAITGHTELQLHFTEEFELARHVKSLANSPFASKGLKKVVCLCDREISSLNAKWLRRHQRTVNHCDGSVRKCDVHQAGLQLTDIRSVNAIEI